MDFALQVALGFLGSNSRTAPAPELPPESGHPFLPRRRDTPEVAKIKIARLQALMSKHGDHLE